MENSKENDLVQNYGPPYNRGSQKSHSISISTSCYLCETDLLGKKLTSSLARALSRRYDFSTQLYYRHLMDKVVGEWKETSDILSLRYSLALERKPLKHFLLRDSINSLSETKKHKQVLCPSLLSQSKSIDEWYKAQKKLIESPSIRWISTIQQLDR
jgi:hypothetical protein